MFQGSQHANRIEIAPCIPAVHLHDVRTVRDNATARSVAALLLCTFLLSAPAWACPFHGDEASCSQPTPNAPDWVALEKPLLTHHVQLTHPDRFIKAGEAYFNPEMTWIIFQAIEHPAEGEEAEIFYSMYVAPLTFDEAGYINGAGEPIRLSPPGAENTCGYFHPHKPGVVLFATTIDPPETETAPGYQREGRDYRWQFSPEMHIVRARIPAIADPNSPRRASMWDRLELETLVNGPEYIAEGSFSKTGRYILYTKLVDGDPDLFIYDTLRDEETPVVQAPGYDGGPFFSADDRYICYRSDRVGNNLLQIYVKSLGFDDKGRPVPGMEYMLTDNEHVNWGPYWHPSGRFLVYATSEMGHYNYEIFAIEFDPDKPRDELGKIRVTYAPRFDGLPVFSPDARYLMWTTQRGERPSSQIWVARARPLDAWMALLRGGAADSEKSKIKDEGKE